MKRFIYNSGRKVFVYNGEFKEEDHPRGEDGKFGGGGESKKEEGKKQTSENKKMEIKDIMKKIESTENDFQSGDCGDLASYIVENVEGAKAFGVRAYDGSVVHVVVEIDGKYYDGLGERTAEEISQDWAYDRPADAVSFVEVEEKNGSWIFKGKEVTTANKEGVKLNSPRRFVYHP